MTTKVPPNLLGSGAIIARNYAEYTGTSNLVSTIPFDDTVPLVSEGSQVLSISHTPKSATNRIRLRFNCFCVSNGGYIISAAIFDGSTCKQVTALEVTSGNEAENMCAEVEFVAGDTAAHTYSVRIGNNSGATTLYINCDAAGNRRFGGAAKATLVLEEIQA